MFDGIKNRVFNKITLVIIFYLLLIFLLFHFESIDSDGNKNLWDIFWYSIVTLTTVGYGDIVPHSFGGKIIGLIFVISSIGVMSALIGKITDSFSEMREKKKMGFQGTKFKNHVVIIGWDSFAKQITEILLNEGQKVAVVTNDKLSIDLIIEKFEDHKKSFFVLHADYDDYESFKKVNITGSRMVYVNLSNDSEELVAILNLRAKYPELEFIVIIDDSNLKNTFRAAGVTHILSKNELASKFMASYIFEPAVADYASDLISQAQDKDDYDIQQFLVTSDNEYVNKNYGELFEYIRGLKIDSLPIGIMKKNGNLIKLPTDDILIQEGDYVIFINNGESAKAISSPEMFNIQQGEHK